MPQLALTLPCTTANCTFTEQPPHSLATTLLESLGSPSGSSRPASLMILNFLQFTPSKQPQLLGMEQYNLSLPFFIASNDCLQWRRQRMCRNTDRSQVMAGQPDWWLLHSQATCTPLKMARFKHQLEQSKI